ncbi:MAG TPA: restriction endonuclease [Usitatibacter sp.]|nr:restriction endonuclease [Usitatibacter sp.]
MRRKPKTSFLEDAITVAAMLPWWACLLLAAISFGLFHWLAGMRTAAHTAPAVVSNLWLVVIGTVGQLLAPLVFLIAAAISAVRQVSRKRVEPSYPSPKPGSTNSTREPTDDAESQEADHDLYDTWKDVSKTEEVRPPLDTSRWSKDLLYALEWKRFELLCAAYFETLGFKTKVAREGADGGVDIHLSAEGSSVPAIVAQCKAWRTYTVGIKAIRELLGVMTAARVPEGVFVTTSAYTAEARQFAAANHIDLIDGDDLLRKIAATRPEDQAALLQLATAGDFMTPTCPSCGIKMVERVAQKTGEKFWGCVRFPNCRFTMPQRSS